MIKKSMSKKTALCLLVLIALTFTLAGCGKSLEQKAAEKYIENRTGADININNEETTIKDKDGNIISIKSNNTLPEGWPTEVPYYQAGTIENSSVLSLPGGQNFSLEISTIDSVEKVLNYYKEAFAAAGFEKQMESIVEDSAVLGFKKDKQSATVGTNKADDQAGITIVQTLLLGE